MKSVIHHLRQLVLINRRIINQLHKDDASIEKIREAFDERQVHTQKIGSVIEDVDIESLTESESESLEALFKRFRKQSLKIQQALDYILNESKNKLSTAVRQRKAEEGYQILK